MQIRRAAVLFLAVAIACSPERSGEQQDRSWSPPDLKEVRGVPIAELKAALATRLSADAPARIDADQWGHTKRLYKLYGGAPLWMSRSGLHEHRALALADAVLQAEQDGLRMELYPIAALAQAISEVKDTKRPSAQQLAEADVTLTAAFAALGEDYLTGQVDPKTVSQSWHIDPQEENVDSALARSIRTAALDEAIATMRPRDANYDGLRAALGRLREITAAGGWPAVPPGEPVKPGEPMDAVRAAALRQRLTMEGISPGATARPAAQSGQSGATYDRALAAAVADFQSRHGIVVDSMLGVETLEALNKPAAYRAAQIAANLERLRWLPRSLGHRHVLVNVPAFQLQAFEGGTKALEMKVIVGEDYADKATPVFSDSMEVVVFRPYWNVTPDIARKEIFPKMSADPGYAARNDYELYREGGATRVRQRPGEKNSLGLVKFLFPNDFNIYLHDTPNAELFKEDVRAFSHGCIRVERPAELAQWALGWDAARVQQMMHGRDNQEARVRPRIPVYIVYGTTYIRNGQIWFGNDLYDRDDKLVAQVLAGALPSAETVQAVQALRRIASR